MKRNNRLALSLLLSVTILGTHINAAPETSKKTDKKVSVAKNDVNNVIDVQGDVVTNQLNIRFIDLFQAMRESKEGVEASAKLELKREELAQSIKAIKDKYDDLSKDSSKDAMLNEQARAKRTQEKAKLERDYKNSLEAAEEEMKLVMQQITEALGKEVEIAVAELAKKEGIDAVIDKVTGRVVYCKSDDTTKIVKSMDKHYAYKVAHNEKSAASTVTVASNKKTAAAA